MPRRRMIDPFFWNDRKVGALTRDERSLVIGSLGQVDDDGRLEGNPAFLKASIFKYDDDLDSSVVEALRSSCLDKMGSWPLTHPYRMVLYTNSGEEYLFFPNFSATNKPSHPTKSQLPAPPPDILPIFSREPQEEIPTESGDIPSQVSLGQSSLGKVRLGKVRVVQEDFAKYLTSEKDLTDFLTDFLTTNLPLAGGRLIVMETVKGIWQSRFHQEMSGLTFQTIYAALEKPPPVLAISIAKTIWYGEGKRNPAKYFRTVLEEREKKNRSP